MHYVLSLWRGSCTSRLFCPWAGRMLWQLHDILLLPCRKSWHSCIPISCMSPHISDVWNVLTGLNYSDFLTFFYSRKLHLFLYLIVFSPYNLSKEAMNISSLKTFHNCYISCSPLRSTNCVRVCIHMHPLHVKIYKLLEPDIHLQWVSLLRRALNFF